MPDAPRPHPPVIPMLAYEDTAAAMDWLADAFGFTEVTRMLDDNGVVIHGEMDAGRGLIMMATPSPDYESPRHHAEHCEAARRWLSVPYIVDGVQVEVDDVDAHRDRAAAAGARILGEPSDNPYGRTYRAEDVEGHRWMFLTPKAEA